MRILQTILSTVRKTKLETNRSTIPCSPLSSFMQKRWRKPIVTAQTRLEGRTRDLKLDKLMNQIGTLKTILKIHELMMSRKRGPFVSVQLMSRWRHLVGLNVGIGAFLHKYPHVFEVFIHPVKRNLCCRITEKMKQLIKEEENKIKQLELECVNRVKRLLMMSTSGKLHVHALRLIRRELGLPEDFWESVLAKYSNDFRLVDLEIVELVSRDEKLPVEEIEKWREKEYREKWLSEFETKFAFPINFPTGFKIEKGFRVKLKNWQRLPYVKPYERKEVLCVRTCGGIERFEKRAVGIIHELLSLTVEKMVEVERLPHFRRDFNMEVNVRELLLKHPGIFYISTKGGSQTVFLRESYSKGCLVESNPIYEIRRRMLDLVLLGCRNSRQLSIPAEPRSEMENATFKGGIWDKTDGDWVIPLLEGFKVESCKDNLTMSDASWNQHI